MYVIYIYIHYIYIHIIYVVYVLYNTHTLLLEPLMALAITGLRTVPAEAQLRRRSDRRVPERCGDRDFLYVYGCLLVNNSDQ